MLQTLKKVFYCPIVCILFAIYPIIHFWSYNWEEVFAQELIILFSAFILFTFIVYKVFRYIFKDKNKTTLITLLFLIMFISFEWFFNTSATVYLYLYSINVFGMMIGRFRVLIPIWIIIFAIVAALIYRTKRSLKHIIHCLKICIFILLCTVLPKILYNAINEKSILTKSTRIDIKLPTKQNLKIGYKPNIYYIILDGYTRSDILQTLFDYNNSEFTDYLNKKGFFVANNGCSNYATTNESIPSSMNVNYIPSDKTCEHFPSESLSNSNLIVALKKLGYFIVNISCREGFTATIKSADLNLNECLLGCFTKEIISRNISGGFIKSNFVDGFAYNVKCNIVKKQLKILKEIPTTIKNAPFFVFCHILSPHRSFVFSSTGNMESIISLDIPSDYKKNYPNEIKWLSREIMDIIDTILLKSDREPIIIIQGDHGSKLSYIVWDTASKKNIANYSLFRDFALKIHMKERLSILNTYYLPGEAKNLLYETITPVNSFRIILNYYFGAKLPILEDRCLFNMKIPFNVKTSSPGEYDKTDYINNIDIGTLHKNMKRLAKKQTEMNLFSF
ncbi:hypothetical protein HN446_03320 [bacterium]|jgi:hypothetical protein|nr:hypothetical protein [bacterium]